MQRLVYSLFTLGAAFALAAFYLYGKARNDYAFDRSLCAFGGECSAAMSWQPAAISITLAAVAIGAALLVAKRSQNLIDRR